MVKHPAGMIREVRGRGAQQKCNERGGSPPPLSPHCLPSPPPSLNGTVWAAKDGTKACTSAVSANHYHHHAVLYAGAWPRRWPL